MQWYKILNRKWNHHGFQYKLGLNIDTVPFYPYGRCFPGGLYYTNKENLHKFLEYGCYIANIKIPPGARVYQEPSGDKWKADKIEIVSVEVYGKHPLFQDIDWVKEAIKKYDLVLAFINKPSEELCKFAIDLDWYSFRLINNPSESICLYALKKNPYVLPHIINQTEEMCLIAVKQDSRVLKYVLNPTEAISLAALRR